MRQRAKLAQSLVSDPEVVLLDEPTAGLDLAHRHSILALARELAAEGTAVIVVLHELDLAMRWADRVLVMDAGRAVALGPPEEALHPDRVAATFGVSAGLLAVPGEGRPVLITRPHTPLERKRSAC